MRYGFLFFFFFSSRRRHTRFDCDWSSDVCSSDLSKSSNDLSKSSSKNFPDFTKLLVVEDVIVLSLLVKDDFAGVVGASRSEERRVGKECRSRWATYR